MTPLQLFLSSLFLHFVFNVLTNEKIIKAIKNVYLEIIIYILFFINIFTMIISVIWGIFYYIKI